MRFIVSSSALYSRIQAVSKVVSSKNSLPILDCFLFQVKENMLTITGSDIETQLTTTVELIESDGSYDFCINAKTILDSMKEISEQPLTFEINPNSLEIQVTYQNGRFSIMGADATQYPIMAEFTNTQTLIIPAETLLRGINSCLFAADNNDIRPIMNGVHMDITAEDITMVATDGQKLVRNKFYTLKGAENAKFVLPRKPAALLKNLLSKEEGDVCMSFTSNHAIIKTQDYVLNCTLIEGKYPNYNAVIPSNNPICATVDRIQFLGALKRVLVFSSQSSSLIKLTLQENSLVVSGQDLDFSTSAEEHIACSYSGPGIKIGFNGLFLLDILNNLNCTDVNLELADTSRPGVIVPAEQVENEHILMLLMPMMLND